MIPETTQRGKDWFRTLFMPIILVLVAIAAFGLGRLSALEEQKGQLIIHQNSQ